MQKSVIDYGFVDEIILNSVSKFEVNEDNFIDSDHNPLMLSIRVEGPIDQRLFKS